MRLGVSNIRDHVEIVSYIEAVVVAKRVNRTK